MYTLYARKGAGSFVVEAVLAETGQRCRRIELDYGPDGKFPRNFLKLNPMAQVPTLVLPDKTVMTESAAMCIYLADRYPRAGLAPAPRSAQRAVYLRWLTFMATSLYSSELLMYYSERYTADPKGAAGVKSAATAALARQWNILGAALGKGPYLLGRKISAADLYLAMLATWSPDLPAFYRRHPNIRALVGRVKARPKIAPLWAANAMP
jgi:glutathione S-transferase